MEFFKSKSAPKRMRDDLYVVVQRIPDREPFAGAPHDIVAARRIFDGVLKEAPEGFFAPHTGASLRVVSFKTWTASRTARQDT
jgi:hypothetical protein